MIDVPWWMVVAAVAAVGVLHTLREMWWERRFADEQSRRADAEILAAAWQEAHAVENRRKRSAREYRPWGVQGGSA